MRIINEEISDMKPKTLLHESKFTDKSTGTNTRTYHNEKQLIDFLHKLSYDNKYIFRGYSLSEQIKPNLFRKNLVKYEIELLDRFERYGRSYYSVSNPIDFLSQGQHFGLPTRLLDFTHNPFVALYFALYTRKASNTKDESDRDYYYIRYCNIENQIYFRQLPSINFIQAATSNSITHECMVAIASLNRVVKINRQEGSERDVNNELNYKEIEINSYIHTGLWDNPWKNESNVDLKRIELTLDKIKEGKLLFIEPNQANQRIIMQQGLFLFPYEMDEMNLINQINKNTELIRVHKNLRKSLKQYLDNIGITAYRLMPDLGNICTEIERSIKIDE